MLVIVVAVELVSKGIEDVASELLRVLGGHRLHVSEHVREEAHVTGMDRNISLLCFVGSGAWRMMMSVELT